MAKTEAERIIEAHPEYETDFKKDVIKCVKNVSLIFFEDSAGTEEVTKDLKIFPTRSYKRRNKAHSRSNKK